MLTVSMWVLWLGFGSSFLAGFSLRYWINSRRFERVNHLGIEQFDGYGDLWSSRFIETMVGTISHTLLAIGLVFVLLIVIRNLLPAG